MVSEGIKQKLWVGFMVQVLVNLQPVKKKDNMSEKVIMFTLVLNKDIQLYIVRSLKQFFKYQFLRQCIVLRIDKLQKFYSEKTNLKPLID